MSYNYNTMGGLHGHIYHLHHNLDLSFDHMKDMIRLASLNKLDHMYEKLDGQNVVFSYDTESKRVVIARGKGDITRGGMDIDEIRAKWAHLPNVLAGYTTAHTILQNAHENIDAREAERIIYGKNKRMWYSAEIVGEANPNVLLYHGNKIVLHKSGYTFDESGTHISRDGSKNFGALLDSGVAKHEDVVSPIQVQASVSENFYQKYADKIDSLIENTPADEDNKIWTVGCYVKARLYHGFRKKYPGIGDWRASTAASTFISTEHKRERAKTLKSVCGPKIGGEIYKLIQNQEKVTKYLLQPLELILHDMQVELLAHTESQLVLNHDTEVARLRESCKTELDKLMVKPEMLAKLKPDLRKLQDLNNITSSMEGITFNYGSDTYKLTGNFAPMNQILGMLRYER